MTTPTPELVIAVWASMQKLYGTQVNNSDLMKLIGSTLDLLGVQDKETFLTQYTTTINRAIYVPFTIGDPSRGLLSQLALCAHEHQHVVQVDREGWATFAAKYVVDHAARAVYEAEAYTCQLEIAWWAMGDIHENLPRDLSWGLKAYGCNDDDVLVVEAALNLARKTILETGIIANEASRRVIQLVEVLGA